MSEVLNRKVTPLEASAAPAAPQLIQDGYRKLLAAERGLLCDHLLRLSADDRALRFLSEVSVQHIEQYCARVDDHYRIVIGYFNAGTLRGAGEIVFNSVPTWLGSCEVALSVEHPYQNAGVGAELLRRLLVLARNRGIGRVRMLCLRGNRKMHHLAKKFAGQLHFAGGEVEGTLFPRWPDAGSIFEESWAAGCAMLNLVFGLGPSTSSAQHAKSITHAESVFIGD